MAKIEIARWVTPGLTPVRLVFTSFGGSAHGGVYTEHYDVEADVWEEGQKIGVANGCPETKGEKIDESHINQFTGEEVEGGRHHV